MALSFIASSAWVSSGTTVTPGVPAGTAAGDFVVITLVSKYEDASLGNAPTGWTDIAPAVNTTGRTAGNDNGNVRIRAFWKIWQAGDAMPSLAPTPNNVSTTMASTYRAGAGEVIDIAGELVADSTVGTPLVLAVAASLGLTAGDIFHWDQVINGDVATWGTSTVTVPSCTVGANTVNTADATTATGTDLRMRSNRNAITAGTSTGLAQVSTALAGTTTNAVGVGLLLRLRAVVPSNASVSATTRATTTGFGAASVGIGAALTAATRATASAFGAPTAATDWSVAASTFATSSAFPTPAVGLGQTVVASTHATTATSSGASVGLGYQIAVAAHATTAGFGATAPSVGSAITVAARPTTTGFGATAPSVGSAVAAPTRATVTAFPTSTPSGAGTPSGLVATAISGTRVDLSWNPVPNAVAYDIERNGSVIVLDHVGTTYSDLGVNPQTEYTYRVRSVA